MSVVTAAVASRPALVQETRLLYSIFLLSCQNSGPLLSCTNATTARCCCLMPTCLFDNWYCIKLIYVCEDSPGALDLHVYLEIARVPLLHSFEWQIYFFATIRNCQPWDWPSLSVTFESIFCRGIWISPSHLLNLSAPGAYHEIDNLLVALWIGVGMICACTRNAYLHQYLTLLQLRKVPFHDGYMPIPRDTRGRLQHLLFVLALQL